MDDSSTRRDSERVVQVGNVPKQPVKLGRKSKKPVFVVIAVLLIVAVAAGSWTLLSNLSGNSGIKKDSYQAVFLTNNQVYFGKLSNVNGDYLTMSNIYYLQVQQAVQPTDSKNAAPATAAEGADNVQLIKLGNELHGPDDHMQISSKQVLFWENLKADGKVSKAIEKYKADNK